VNLAQILGFKFDDAEGIETRNNILTSWPLRLGPEPSQSELVRYQSEYEDYQRETMYLSDRGREYKTAFSIEGTEKASTRETLAALINAFYGDVGALDEIRKVKIEIDRNNPRPD